MSINNPFIPTTLEVNSLGIGFSSLSNLYNLNLKSDEYLVVGERENTTGNIMDQRYNMIVNNQGVAINTNRSTFNSNNNLYNTGLYVDNNIVCSGNIIAKGLQFDNITLSSNINADIISNLIKTINNKQDLFSKSTYKTNIINTGGTLISTIDNIYTPSYLTIGGNSVTANNKHSLNIVETTNNTIENIQLSIRNSSVSDDNFELGGGKLRIGIIGGNYKSPAIITTTEGMSLEFHVGVKTTEINKLYENGAAFPEYNLNSSKPAMTIDERKNIAIGVNKTNLYNFSKYFKIDNKITSINVSEYAKLEINGMAAIENLLIYDYFTNSYTPIEKLFIRSKGYSLDASQIREGLFYGDLYEFNNNVNINSNLNVNTITGNNGIFESIYASNIEINNAIFNDNSIFTSSANVDINSKIIFNNELYITDANNLIIDDKRVNILNVKPIYLNPDLLESCNISYTCNQSNSILFFASENIINFSGCNLIIPNKLGVGIKNEDDMLEQLNIVNREEEKFELALHDKTDVNETVSAYIGHLSKYNDKPFDRDNSLIINTSKSADKYHNIYFIPGVDIANRSSKNLNENITLSINQNNKVGINTSRPLYDLDVNGSIITNDIYIRKKNKIIYKSNNFIYNISDINIKTYNIYDKDVSKYCINYLEENINILNNDELKTLNINGSVNANLYYENNISIETFKNKPDNTGIYTNKNISIGWLNEKSVVPLQIRNTSITNYNNSIIRFYRGKKGGGINNNASFSGIDICNYESIPGFDKDNFKWYIYKNHLDISGTANEDLVGPLQIGYTNNSITPDPFKKKAISIFFNNDETYHIDINKNDGNFDFNQNAAMSIYGDLEVYGNINIIDTNNCNYTYKLNGIQYSSNAITNLINQLPNNSGGNENNDTVSNNTDKKDIVINAEKITILPNKSTFIGYSEDWFLYHINYLHTKTVETPLIVYQKNRNTPITRFASTSYNNSVASIELGTYDNNTYFGDIKNMVSLNVSGQNNNTLLEFGSYDKVYDKTYIPFMSFYHINSNDFSSCYTHLGGSKYPSRNVITGEPIVNNVTLHIEDNNDYGLQITANEKSPMINLHRKNGSNSIYYIINGADDNNNFSINTAVSYDNNYIPDKITPVLTISGIDKNGIIRKGSRVGFNKLLPETSVDINGITNEPCIKFTNKYDELKLNNYNVNITVIASNMYAQPKVSYNNNNIYYTGINYTINSNDMPLVDNNNKIIIDDYKKNSKFIVNKTISFDNFINYKLSYNYITSITTENLLTNIISSNNSFTKNNLTIDIFNDTTYNFEPIIYSQNTDNTIYVPESEKIIFNKFNNISINTVNFDIIDITGILKLDNNYELNYNYSNFYKGPEYLNYNYNEYLNIKNNNNNIIYEPNIEKIIINVNNSFDTYLYNSNLCDKLDIKVYINTIDIDSNIILNTFTSNIIYYYSLNNVNNVKLEILRDKDIIINTSVTAPEKLIKEDNEIVYFNKNISIIGGIYNININKVTDFLNIRPDGFSFSENLETSIDINSINTCNYSFDDNFIENGTTFYSKINIDDNYKIYVPNKDNFYIGVNYLSYEPHIILENSINLNNSNIIEIDNVHKIYSYDGDFKLNITSKGTENNLLVISKLGDINVKKSVTTNDIYLQGKIYDKLGNDLINIVNNYDYSNLLYYHDIRACNYYIQSSNMKFTPTGSKGFIINSGQNIINTDESYNIFTVYDNDENNKYTRFNIKKEGFVSINKDIGEHALDVSGTIQSDDDIITPNLNVIGGDNGIVRINTPMYTTNYVDIYNSNNKQALNINHNSLHNNILSVSENNDIIFNIKKGGKIGINKIADDVFDLDVIGNIRISDTIYSSNLIVYGNTVELSTVSYKTENLEIDTQATDGPALIIRQNGSENILDFYNINKNVLKFTNAGDLGIGVQNPEYNLHVNGNVKFNSNLYVNYNVGIGTNNTDNKLEIYGGNALFNNNVGIGAVDNMYKLNVSDGDVKFCSNLFIDRNVSIGLLSTTNKLEVSGGDVLFNSNLNIGNNVGIGGIFSTNNNEKLLVYGNIITTNIGTIHSGSNLIVDNNVAIGANITDYKLYVANGDVKIESNIFINNNIGIGTNSTINKLEVSNGNALFNNNVGIGSINNLYKLNISGGNVKINSNLYVDKIGINTIDPSSALTINNNIIYSNNDDIKYDHSLAALTINSSTSIPNDERNIPFPIVHLTRDGSSLNQPGVKATFSLSRHIIKSDEFPSDNNTRLDISLSNSNYDSRNIITMLSNGNIGLGVENPEATLHINGSFIVSGTVQSVAATASYSPNSLLFVNANKEASTKSTLSFNTSQDRMGIGIASPSCALDIIGSIKNTQDINIGNNLHVANNSYFTNNIFSSNNAIIGTTENQSVFTSNYRLQVNNSKDDIGLAYDKSSCNLYVKNDIIASAFSQLSDINVKTNISNLEYNDDIMNLRPVSFNWSSNYYNKQKIGYEDVGLIAQEVEMHIPGLVFDNVMLDGNSWKTVNYTGLIPYMIKHIQNLNKRIENLENKINKM